MADKNRPYDPKLQKVRRMIHNILKANDVAGHIVLYSESHVEFLDHIEPSWSVAKFEEVEGCSAIRIKSKRENFESKAEQDRCTEATIGMIMSMIDMGKLHSEAMQKVADELRKHVHIFHPILNPQRDIYSDPNFKKDR